METALPKFRASNFRGQSDVTKFRDGALSEKIVAAANAVHNEIGPDAVVLDLR